MELAKALSCVLGGATLARDESRAVFRTALSEDGDPVALAGLLVALAQRGETAEEVAGAAEALRDAMTPFEHDRPDAIDTCGTGGDGLQTFNVSTAAALVAAAAGAVVVKHGNRAASSRSGSADLLEALGGTIELDPAAARAVLDATGFTYLHAPAFHPAMRFAAPVRRALGVRTVFNLLGPLCNPGRVRRQLLGVADASRLRGMAAALEELGADRAYVVHGAGGADELTLAGENSVVPVGAVPAGRFDAEALGLGAATVDALRGGDAGENAAIALRVFEGEPGPLRDAVVLNAAAALVVADVAADAADGAARAAEALDSGATRRLVDGWVEATRREARA